MPRFYKNKIIKSRTKTDTTATTTPTQAPALAVTPTPEQQSIYDHLSTLDIDDNKPDDLSTVTVINAVAGSGKTHTSIQSLVYIPREMLVDTRYVSFAKANAEDAARKMGNFQGPGQGNVEGIASTHHKLGKTLYESWCLQSGKPRPVIAKDKIKRTMAKVASSAVLRDLGWSGARAVEKLISVAKAYYLFPEMSMGSVSYTTLLDLADAFDIELVADNPRLGTDQILDIAVKTMFVSLKDTTCMDFEDMIAQPVYLDMVPRSLDLLYVDEAQDSNPVQVELDFRIARNLVLVGDDNQSIYAFRGAGSGGMNAMAERAESEGADVTEFPLSINWRCGKEIIRYAQRLVPAIKASPKAIDGDVRFDYSRSRITDIIREVNEMNRRGNGTTTRPPSHAILSRRNAGLFPYFFSLLKSGIPSYKAGGADNMIQSIRSLTRKYSNTASRDQFLKLCYTDLDMNLSKKLLELKKQGRLNKNSTQRAESRTQDLRECIKVIMDNCQDPADVDIALKRLCPEQPEPGAVCLSTIHKSKGQEYDHVYITDLEYFGKIKENQSGDLAQFQDEDGDGCGFMDNSMKKPAANFDIDWDQQETNLAYVAITRAKKTLTFDGPIPECIR